MTHFIEFEKLSKKEQKAILKSYRKPPIPPSRKSDSKAAWKKKHARAEKQKLRKGEYE